jgi:hypothetical protein
MAAAKDTQTKLEIILTRLEDLRELVNLMEQEKIPCILDEAPFPRSFVASFPQTNPNGFFNTSPSLEAGMGPGVRWCVAVPTVYTPQMIQPVDPIHRAATFPNFSLSHMARPFSKFSAPPSLTQHNSTSKRKREHEYSHTPNTEVMPTEKNPQFLAEVGVKRRKEAEYADSNRTKILKYPNSPNLDHDHRALETVQVYHRLLRNFQAAWEEECEKCTANMTKSPQMATEESIPLWAIHGIALESRLQELATTAARKIMGLPVHRSGSSYNSKTSSCR